MRIALPRIHSETGAEVEVCAKVEVYAQNQRGRSQTPMA